MGWPYNVEVEQTTTENARAMKVVKVVHTIYVRGPTFLRPGANSLLP